MRRLACSRRFCLSVGQSSNIASALPWREPMPRHFRPTPQELDGRHSNGTRDTGGMSYAHTASRVKADSLPLSGPRRPRGRAPHHHEPGPLQVAHQHLGGDRNHRLGRRPVWLATLIEAEGVGQGADDIVARGGVKWFIRHIQRVGYPLEQSKNTDGPRRQGSGRVGL